MTVTAQHRSGTNGNGQRGGGRPGGPNGPGGPGRPFLDGSGQNGRGGPKRRPGGQRRPDNQPPHDGGQGQGQGQQAGQENEPDITFMLGAGYDAANKRPIVEFTIIQNGQAGERVRLPAEAAKALGINLLTVAEAGIHDGFLVSFLRDHVGVERDMIQTMLDAFASYRERALYEQFRSMADDNNDPGSSA